MTNLTDRNQPDSTELKSYLVMTDSAFGTNLVFGDENFYDLNDCYSSIGWYQATSKQNSIEQAEAELLRWGCSKKALDRINLVAFSRNFSPKKKYLHYTTTVAGYKFPERVLIESNEDESEENLWKLALRSSHFSFEEGEEAFSAWIKQGVENDFVDLDYGYTLYNLYVEEE